MIHSLYQGVTDESVDQARDTGWVHLQSCPDLAHRQRVFTSEVQQGQYFEPAEGEIEWSKCRIDTRQHDLVSARDGSCCHHRPAIAPPVVFPVGSRFLDGIEIKPHNESSPA